MGLERRQRYTGLTVPFTRDRGFPPVRNPGSTTDFFFWVQCVRKDKHCLQFLVRISKYFSDKKAIYYKHTQWTFIWFFALVVYQTDAFFWSQAGNISLDTCFTNINSSERWKAFYSLKALMVRNLVTCQSILIDLNNNCVTIGGRDSNLVLQLMSDYWRTRAMGLLAKLDYFASRRTANTRVCDEFKM